MRPFGVKVVADSRRGDFKHVEVRGVIGFFMVPGDGPSMDRVALFDQTKIQSRFTDTGMNVDLKLLGALRHMYDPTEVIDNHHVVVGASR